LTAFGSFAQASRTPTANELYRGFRAGNVLTTPNPNLRPERLTGLEGGVRFARGTVSLRATAYASSLADAVSNVTLASTPALIVRERQNTDTIRANGLELEAEWRPKPDWRLKGLAVFASSRFAETPAQPALEGNRVPQTPRVQVGGSVAWARPAVATVAAEFRSTGEQYDDDLNTLVLRRSSLVNVTASRALGKLVHVFVAVENAFDRQADVGRTPVLTLGYPRSIRGGIRMFLR